MRIFLLTACLLTAAWATYAQTATLVPAMQNGPDDKRLNLLVVGEGFTANKMWKLEDGVDTIISRIFLTEAPFKQYRNFFNMYILEVACADSGLRHPATATDITENPASVYMPNNCFGTSYDYANIHSMIFVYNNALLMSLIAQHYPSADWLLTLNNSSLYPHGQAGFGVGASVNMNNQNFHYAVGHEMGHFVGGVADEYWVNTWPVRRPNRDTTNDPNQVKWKAWMGVNNIGAYPFGTVGTATHYRPHQQCKMQFTTRGFCSVCIEAIIDTIYHRISPIESATPATDTVQSSASLQFALQLVYPQPNTLVVEWKLNGTTLAGGLPTLTIANTQLQTGSNTLVAYVTDTTSMSRSYWPASGYQFSREWQIVKTNTGTSVTNTGRDRFFYKLYPNPVESTAIFEFENDTDNKELDYEITGIDGKALKTGKAAIKRGANSINLDLAGLANGIYIFKAYSTNVNIESRIIKN